MNFDFIEVFTRAAKITWKYKVLWIFGILASCGRNSGSSSNSSGGNGNNATNNPFSSEMMGQMEDFAQRMMVWFEQNTWIIWVFVAFALLSIAVQIFFNLVGTAGLARGVVRAENGAEVLPFGELFSESLSYFWRLFGAALIIWLPAIIVFVLAMLAVAIPAARSGGNDAVAGEIAGGMMILLFLISICCCLFPISIALNLYHLQVKRSIIVDGLGIFDSLARGWQVFSKNIFILLIIGVILFIASFIIGVLIMLPVILLMLPLIQALIEGDITSWQPFIAVGIFLACYSPVAWLINGLLTTYTESVWTLTYLRVTKLKEEVPVFIDENA